MSDKYASSVILHAPFDGSDGSTSFTDVSASARALTANGNAQLDTAQAKWGSASLLLDGSGDFASAADHADWAFAGPFTIEAFVRFASLSGSFQSVAAHYNSFGNLRSWWLTFANNCTELQFAASTSGSGVQTAVLDRWPGADGTGLTLATGVWYHVAATRDASNVLRVFLDGVAGATQPTLTGSLFNSTQPMQIGCRRSGGAATNADFFNGWIDEVRITSGVARYTAPFNPPKGPFSRAKRLGVAGQFAQPVIVTR